MPRLKPKTAHALRMLIRHGSLSSNEARALGCGDRFAARVKELRSAFGDAAVPDEWMTVGDARFKRYRWAGPTHMQQELELVA